jgi:hypothetical protein
LHGRESSIEDESSASGEEDDSYEEDSMDEFQGWPPELLLTPQPIRGLQHKQKRPVQGTSAGMAKEGSEGRGRGSVHTIVCEGGAGGFSSRLRGEGGGYEESGVGGGDSTASRNGPWDEPVRGCRGPGLESWGPKLNVWEPGLGIWGPEWGAGDRGWTGGDEVLGGDQFHQREGCSTKVGGWDPNFYDVGGCCRQYVGESSHGNDDISCGGLQDGIIYGDYFAGVN